MCVKFNYLSETTEIMKRLLFATGNKGKVEEMRPLFEKHGFELEQVDVDVKEIDALNVEDVARRKAIDSYEAVDGGKPVIVEDTGFFVEALGGFPGAKAAFFDETAGVDGLLKLMKDVDGRGAYFKTAIAFCDNDQVKAVTGKIEGRIPEQKRGESHPHLPYDSFFVPENGDGSTFAGKPELKQEFSHRKEATLKFLDWLESR